MVRNYGVRGVPPESARALYQTMEPGMAPEIAVVADDVAMAGQRW